ncbi:FecR family protein [Sphingobacterium sp. SG20118]|uniref:FecR family protein n=1 Tax=Sphingobacterium sp. SG20118 TaxID=3367156 RepID=UPI0037DFC73E
MSKKEEFKRLIKKYQNGQASQQEIIALTLLKDDPDFQMIMEELWEEGLDYRHELNGEDLASKIYTQIVSDERVHFNQSPEEIKQRPLINLKKISIAAAILCFGFIGLWIYRTQNQNREKPLPVVTLAATIVPGTERASIILGDGKVIDLDKLRGDTVITTDEFSIIKTKDGQISYQINPTIAHTNKLVYNTIVTPKGGEYKVILSDGSKVWLNASTTFKYPIVFAGHQRDVVLTGEAYFDVAEQYYNGRKVPFVVQTGQQRLEVLGTQFNINSYGKQVVTTLVSGKVQLHFNNSNLDSKVLMPNEQAVYDGEAQHYTQSKVDPYNAVAWKNGNFAFKNASLHEVMSAIGRWYDVEIIFQGNFKDVYFSGAISKYSDINKLLKTISLTGGFTFEVKERKVYVMK